MMPWARTPHRSTTLVVLVAVAILSTAAAAPAIAADDAARCTGNKLKAAATYSRCLLKVQARAASRQQPVDTGKIAACESKMAAGWQKAEDRGAAECPTLGDEQHVRSQFDCMSESLSAFLAGSGPAPVCVLSSTTTTTITTTTTQPCQNTGTILSTTTTTMYVVPRCSNSIQDGPETDVDCGGDCHGCPTGGPCNVGGDCASLVCTSSVCAAPTCTDGQRNGFESGVDCGAGGCPGCPAGVVCIDCGQCASNHCDSNWCQ